MNEKIKQLAEQADNFADDKIRMPGEYHPDWHDVRDEKFAELIVKECSNFLKDTLDDHFAAEQLEEHFGVEE